MLGLLIHFLCTFNVILQLVHLHWWQFLSFAVNIVMGSYFFFSFNSISAWSFQNILECF